MDFGKTDYTLLDNLDLRLPQDGSVTSVVLRGGPVSDCKFRLGLTHWGRTEWVGKLYPFKTKEKEFLSFYGRQFNAIELNATHYKPYDASVLAKWRNMVPASLVFCPKLLKDLSHKGTLTGKESLLQSVLQAYEQGFGEQLGPIFIQLSEHFGIKRRSELFDFIKSLDKRFSWFLEVRDKQWFADDSLFQFLKEEQVGSVITDTAGNRYCVHMQVTIPKLFVRFVANDQHPSDFIRLNDWVDRIKRWKERGLQEVNFFIHSHDENKVLEIAQYAVDRFNKECNAGLQPLSLDGTGGSAVTAPTLF